MSTNDTKVSMLPLSMMTPDLMRLIAKRLIDEDRERDGQPAPWFHELSKSVRVASAHNDNTIVSIFRSASEFAHREPKFDCPCEAFPSIIVKAWAMGWMMAAEALEGNVHDTVQ